MRVTDFGFKLVYRRIEKTQVSEVIELDIQEYVSLTIEEKYKSIISKIDTDIFDVHIDGNELKIKHLQTNLNFVYIPGGSFRKGLTDLEYSLVRKINDFEYEEIDLEHLRPVHTCNINDLLITEYPVSWETLKDFYPQYQAYKGTAWLNKESVDMICSHYNFRLPTDDEIEYIARCGKRQLFPFGNLLPQDKSILEKWLVMDYDKSKMLSNELGVYGLFCGEWTSTHFTKSYSETDLNEPQEHFCIRGGASVFWPWQDCGEWLQCLCAYHMSSEGLFEDKSAAFRFVFEV